MINVLILAGGEGTRFWPLSRRNRPKQFVQLLDNQKNMLQQTVERINNLVPIENIFIATNTDYKQKIQEQVKEIKAENIIIEPLKRNTAAAIGLSALFIESKYPGSIMIVLPIDHLINDEVNFIETIKRAIEVASSGEKLVTLGIKPTYPETGYGYIHIGQIDQDFTYQVFKVKRFIEKPDRAKAETFLKTGNYFWNSGIFIWQNQVILESIKKNIPQLYDSLQKIKRVINTDWFGKVILEEFKELTAVSIDSGILEKVDNVYVLPGYFAWGDLGNLLGLKYVKEQDERCNTIIGKHLGVDTENSIIYNQDKLITTIGLKNMIIINTEDVILICDKKRAQEVKKIREKLEKCGLIEYL
ncbi:NTP transferase domain-containing protein [Iocasia frigidifontis]|uniref:mannose-1-phosphate guanylyltransferase n=1 Tax=Iocasia fonsfrigidae TaxID=2682810 RepID=A0A8A7KE40_9FIRM|nr:mannose-1-phosphate guanylyltransferase [Iocasia fonsfrigidae]QTL97699.1 NTP transferase domain-containing protein [Iocasia fonsfrigidae]